MAEHLDSKGVGSWNHMKIHVHIEDNSSYTDQIVQIWTAQLDQAIIFLIYYGEVSSIVYNVASLRLVPEVAIEDEADYRECYTGRSQESEYHSRSNMDGHRSVNPHSILGYTIYI